MACCFIPQSRRKFSWEDSLPSAEPLHAAQGSRGRLPNRVLDLRCQGAGYLGGLWFKVEETFGRRGRSKD